MASLFCLVLLGLVTFLTGALARTGKAGLLAGGGLAGLESALGGSPLTAGEAGEGFLGGLGTADEAILSAEELMLEDMLLTTTSSGASEIKQKSISQ